MTMTLQFTDAELLSTNTISAIGQTVAARRNLRELSSSKPVPVKIDASDLSAVDRYTIEHALENLLREVRCLQQHDDEAKIHIDIIARPDECRIGVDLLGSLTFKLRTYDKDEIALMLVYGLAALLWGLDKLSHAEAMARQALSTGKPSYSPFIALDACRALSSDPVAMVELAILNNFHEKQQIEYAVLSGILMTSHADPANSRTAAERLFFSAASAAQKIGNTQGEASAYYSIGNMARAESRFLHSISFYNKARKAWDAYISRTYFLEELAGTLYLARRYKLAAKMYGQSIVVGEDHISDMRLGDALLMSGQAAHAHEAFSSALANAGESWREQTAATYVWLSARIADRFGDSVPVARKAASNRLDSISADEISFDVWQEIVLSIDTFCEVANFNLGIAAANRGEPELALEHFLICATRLTNDGEAWSNALKCAWNMKDGEMSLNVMTAALRFGGPDAYALFRTEMADQFNSNELVEALDEIARTLKPRWENDGFMLRAHTDDGMVTVFL